VRHGLLTADQNARLQALLSGTVVDEKVADALIGYLGHVDGNGTAGAAARVVPPPARAPGEILVLCSDGLHDYAGLNHLKFLRKLGKYAETMTLPDIAQALIAGRERSGWRRQRDGRAGAAPAGLTLPLRAGSGPGARALPKTPSGGPTAACPGFR
jgi:hypothetical protein